MRVLTAAAALLVAAAPAAAQQHQAGHHAGGEFPAGWQGRVDRESQRLEDVRFMTMGDRLHVITGPHVILWNAEHTARGAYDASATFTQAKAPERLDAFGVLVGGQNLDQPNQDYLYFLARHDGSFMVRHRAGSEVHTLADWTPHTAVRKATATEPATNTLTIEARPDRIRFLVNGEAVYALDRVPMLNTDGIVGLRVGHHMDVIVSDLSIRTAQ